MDLIQRVKNICVTPQTEWPVIADEATSTSGLITSYVIPLSAASAVAGLIGGSVIGRTLPLVGTYRTPLVTGIGLAVLTVVMAVIGCLVISAIINALAPTFSAQKNSAQALKVVVYAYTPAWVAGVLQILPILGILGILGSLYGLYLLYLGLPTLMKCPPDKAAGYTVVVVVCAIVVSLVLGAVGAAVGGVGATTAGLMSGDDTRSASDADTDADSPLGRLERLGRALEDSARRADEAAGTGDEAGQAAAALEGLGALLGGGERVDPLELDVLQPFIPDTFAGLPRTSSNAEKNGVGIIMVSKAEATYDDGGDRSATLEITDTGGVSGLMGLASWMGVEQQREDADGYERTGDVDGRLTHEKHSMSGADEFAIVVAERFLINAAGRGVDVDALRTAVLDLDLGGLESAP